MLSGTVKEKVGMILIGISVLWLMSVAGADDLNTMQHVFTPWISLAIKAAFGLLGMGFGAALVNTKGGSHDESNL